MNSTRVSINNLAVSFLHREVKSPSATVVFIHGFPFGKEIWKSQLESLSEQVQGISYDIRGYGESDPGHGYFSIDLFANDLINLIEHLHLNRVVLCGVSMGGYIALRAYELRRDLFLGLILCDTNANADSNIGKINRFASIERIQAEGKGAFANDFLKKVFSSRTPEIHHELVNSIFKLIMDLPESTLCATLLALASRTDTSEFLESVTVPALIIRGAEDQLMTTQQAENLHQAISSSEFVVVPEAGHLPNLENPGVFNAAMNSFLERLM